MFPTLTDGPTLNSSCDKHREQIFLGKTTPLSTHFFDTWHAYTLPAERGNSCESPKHGRCISIYRLPELAKIYRHFSDPPWTHNQSPVWGIQSRITQTAPAQHDGICFSSPEGTHQTPGGERENIHRQHPSLFAAPISRCHPAAGPAVALPEIG